MLSAIAKEGVHLFEHYFAIDLITSKKARKIGVSIDGVDNNVLGLYLYDGVEKEVITISFCRSACYGRCWSDISLYN